MHIRKRMALVILLMVQGAVASAEQAVPAQPKPSKGSAEEKICRSEAPTGSLITSKRICMTRAQWQAQADASRSATQDLQERGHITTCTAPGGCAP